MKKTNEIIKPFAVLVIICVIAGGVLALTNHIASPIIEKNKLAAAEATRRELLPTATTYEELSLTDPKAADSAYVGKDADGDVVGYIISVTRSGYKSVSVAVALDPEGTVTGLSVDVSSETKGIGSKAGEEAYVSKYIGISDSADDVDLIAQATYSSSAVRECVNAALDVYCKLGG